MEHRKSLHGNLINEILRLGDTFKTEKISYKAWQKLFGKSVGFRSPGRFFSELKRKAESAGGKFIEFPTQTTKLSQTCHCGDVKKKPLSQRFHSCDCGVAAQRDLYSSFLACFVEEEAVEKTKKSNKTEIKYALHAGQAKKAWPGAEPLLQAAWKEASERQSVIGGQLPSSCGKVYPCSSQNGSLATPEKSKVETLFEAVVDVLDVVPGTLKTGSNARSVGESLEETVAFYSGTPCL